MVSVIIHLRLHCLARGEAAHCLATNGQMPLYDLNMARQQGQSRLDAGVFSAGCGRYRYWLRAKTPVEPTRHARTFLRMFTDKRLRACMHARCVCKSKCLQIARFRFCESARRCRMNNLYYLENSYSSNKTIISIWRTIRAIAIVLPSPLWHNREQIVS